MRVRALYITHVGKVRFSNEDALLINGKVVCETSMGRIEEEEIEGETLKFAVADGMGGMPCGEKASCLALQSLKERKVNDLEDVRPALVQVKGDLDRYVEEHGECYGMGTAMAGIILKGEEAIVFNVGDCRVYSLGREGFARLTEDHTEVFQMFKRGMISEEEIRSHPFRNILTSALVGGGGDFEVFSIKLPVEEGDRFLVCSDGLWDEVSTMRIEESLSSSDLEEGMYRLFQSAYGGGRDNISFIALEVLK